MDLAPIMEAGGVVIMVVMLVWAVWTLVRVVRGEV
jgi:hypothetical protein